MTKITIDPDCGNSPKKEFLKDINVAFAKGDVDFFTDSVSDTIVWNIIGQKKIEGKQNFSKELEHMASTKVTELTLEHILTHGSEGAVSGIMTMENGNTYAFSDFYRFSSAKGSQLASITSYVLEI